jgi:hypothetical protein
VLPFRNHIRLATSVPVGVVFARIGLSSKWASSALGHRFVAESLDGETDLRRRKVGVSCVRLRALLPLEDRSEAPGHGVKRDAIGLFEWYLDILTRIQKQGHICQGISDFNRLDECADQVR